MTSENYRPEAYWDVVARNIKERIHGEIIAGDDEPYYRYKREKFLRLFDKLEFKNRKVLEVGSGPGGNLIHLQGAETKELVGVDLSSQMIELSRQLIKDKSISVIKIDGTELPFPDRYFDLSFTSTVLQHNTDEEMLRKLIKSICRVTNTEIVLFERIEHKITGHDSNVGRPVEYYSGLFATNSFKLVDTQFLNIQASYIVCGTVRKVFNKRSRREGEAVSGVSKFLEKVALPVTKQVDKLIKQKRDLGMLRFVRMADLA